MVTVIYRLVLFVLVLACMVCSVLSVSGKVRCLEREREALLVFKRSITDDYGVLSSWGGTDQQWECCKWAGVICSNITGNVIGLQLAGDGYDHRLGGKISPSLLELHYLSSLDLSSNDFGESRIPEFIGSMKQLQHLTLSKSNFSGTVSDGFGNLTNLQTLDLSFNALKMENLNWLSNLSLLSRLVLSGSDISDPNWLQQMTKLGSLEELYLQFCQITPVTSSRGLFINPSSSLLILHLSNSGFTSSIFNWLFNLSTSLVSLDLSNNQLEGPVPDGFGKLIFLKYLDLSVNKFSGGIPKSLGNMSSLQSLLVSKNRLNESLAEAFVKLCCKAMASLEAIDLSVNQLTGSLPDLSSFLALRELYIHRNRLTGLLTSSIGQLARLEELDISYNSLEGPISELHFMKLRNLRVLALSFNGLTFKISPGWIPPFQLDLIHLACCVMGPHFPAWLQTQRSFSSLDLSQTGISEEVPKWLWDLSPRLTYLNLSINNISGEFPDLSSKFHESSLLDISYNKFSGPLPTFHPKSVILQLSHNMFHGLVASLCGIETDVLLLLDLSYNQLFGQIPNCWEKMGKLFTLNLASNRFSGQIPESFRFLSSLETLILRQNNLSGELPVPLGEWQNLRIIDVGQNQLTGNIPAWIGMYCHNMIILSLQQNIFHGIIPSELCHLSKIQILDLSRNNIIGRIPQCLNNFTFLAENDRINESSVSIFSDLRSDYMVDLYIASVQVQWKGKEFMYNKTLGLLKLLDLSSNRLIGSIPHELFTLKGLISFNLSRNSLSGNIDSDIGNMKMLESLDLSRNRLSGAIPDGLAQLHYLQVLDLSSNNLSGRIPWGTQLQSFNASAYAWNDNLCGFPLAPCLSDGLHPSSGDQGDHCKKDNVTSLSSMKDFGLSAVVGFVFGFLGCVGFLVVRNSGWVANFRVA